MTITLKMEEDIAVITMDDGKANAVSPAFLATMNRLLDEAESHAKAIVLTGRDGRFSGGFDLKIMQGASAKEVAALVDGGGELALRFFENKLPVVMACNGHALAMGAMLLMSADTRIGTAGDFKIGLNETQIGMVMPHFGVTLPKARLAQTHYTRAVVQAELFDPDTAVAVGFLDKVVPASDLMSTAIEAAKALGALSAGAYHGNKIHMRRAAIDAMKAKLPLN